MLRQDRTTQSSLRAVGANELISSSILSRQQRGNPEIILNNSNLQNAAIQNRYWVASPLA